MTFHTKLRRAKTLPIRYNKIHGFNKIHNKVKYLALFDDCFDKIYDRIKYLVSEKGGIANSINHNFWKISIDSYNSLPIEKIFTFEKVVILISQLLIRVKKAATLIYFLKMHRIKINPIHNIFKRMFAYCKCYISIKL